MVRRSAASQAMDRWAIQAAAGELERLLHAAGDYGHIQVRRRGQHLIVAAALADGGEDPIARATALGSGQWGLSFRTHTGRWEPLPISGSLARIVEGLTGELAPYLQVDNF